MVDPVRIDHIRSNLKLLSRLRQLDKLKRKRQFRRDRPQRRHHAFQSLRSNHRDRLRPLRISHRQQKSRQTADMISMIMSKTDHINGFEAPTLFLDRNLCSFSAVDQKAAAIATRHHRSQPAIRKRHHSAGSQ